jgi:hypothetical protein
MRHDLAQRGTNLGRPLRLGLHAIDLTAYPFVERQS